MTGRGGENAVRASLYRLLRGKGHWAWVHAIMSVLGARSFAAAAAFFANLLVARALESTAFSQFYLLFSMMTIVAGLTGPAIDTSLVRFASKHIGSECDESLAYFKAVFYVKCGILLLTMLVATAAARPLLGTFFSGFGDAAVPAYAIVAAFFGGAAVSMWGFAQSYFQAHQRFTRYAGYEFCSSMLRLVLVLVLLGLGYRNVLLYLAAYVSAPFTMVLVSWYQLPRRVFTVRTSLEVGRELFRFAKWVILATVFTTVTQRLDLLLLNYGGFQVPKPVVGQYSAAVSIVLAGELVLLTFFSVLLPKASQLKEAWQLRRFIGQFRVPSFLFCLGLGFSIPIVRWFVPVALGPSYAGAEVYFTILLLGVMAALVGAPPVTAIYSLGRSSMMAGFEGLRLALTLAIGIVVVPRYGAVGMAFTMASVRAVVSLLTYLAAHQQIKRVTIAEYSQG